jgi:hypothetical protein
MKVSNTNCCLHNSCIFEHFILTALFYDLVTKIINLQLRLSNYTKFYNYTGLFELTVGVLTTCHTQYTWDRSFSFRLFRKMGHTVGCGMPSSLLLPLTVGFLVLRMNACLTCSTCSSVTDDLPVLLLLHTHTVSWNCAYHLQMELSDGGCFPNLMLNCRWTIVTDRYLRNVIIIIIIIYLSWSWVTCWPVPVSRIQKPLQRSAMVPSAIWGIAFHYPG